MKKNATRILLLTIVVLFLVTSSALTIAVIVQSVKDGKKKDATISKTEKPLTTPLANTQLSNFTPVATIDSLQKVDTTAGTGAEVKTGDSVTVDYTGAVAATGIIFQSSLDSGQPASFPLANVIKGWQEGVPGMKVGGTRRLLIPAALAYGPNPPGGSGIPANADLVFDITLRSIDK